MRNQATIYRKPPQFSLMDTPQVPIETLLKSKSEKQNQTAKVKIQKNSLPKNFVLFINRNEQ